MKVKIRKAQFGETPRFISKLNKFVKNAGGQSDAIDAYIDSELNNGTSPEEVISALVQFKIPREKIEDIVYEMYDTLQESNNYDPSTETAPYDKESPYSKKVKDKVKVEEVVDEIPESEKYGYYDSNNLGSKLVKETNFDEDGEYEDGGQYMDNSIFPKPKQPYFVGMDANAVPGAFAFGGSKQSKSKYINDYIKKLKKAAEGDQVENSEFYLPPAGSIGDPMGNNTKQNQMFAGTVKQMGNEAMMKKQAEESYQNMNTKANGGSQEPHDWIDELHGYGEALQHSMTAMDENAINTAIMKKEYGRGGRIRRANKALFGTPHSIPGVDTSYEFGPLGGIRKATADWDLKALGDLVNFLPGAYGMMPGMNSGNWKSVSYPSQVRQKVITSVNNTALDEVANNTKSSSATQGHLSSNKKGLNCPPGAVYDASSDQCIGPDGLPVSLLENPFANPYASIIPGSYQSKQQKTLNKFIPLSSNNPNGSNTDWMGENVDEFPETWTPEYKAYHKAISPEDYSETNKPWAPFTDPHGEVYNYNNLEGVDPKTGLPLEDATGNIIFDKDAKKFNEINLKTAYSDNKVASSPYSYLLDEEYIKANNIRKFTDYTPEQQKQLGDWDQASSLTRDKQGNEYSSSNFIAPDYKEQFLNPATAGMQLWRDANDFKDAQWNRFSPHTYEEDGGFIDSSQMQPGVLQKFISGGNEYAYGGGIQRFGPGGGFDSWAKDKFNVDGSSKFKLNAGNSELLNPFNKTSTKGVPNKNLIGANSSNAFSNIPGSNTKQPATTTTNTNTVPGQQQFTPQQIQQIQQFLQYQKTLQGQQGQQGNMQFGPPKKLGFGFSKDFSYTQGFSPNWNVPEGTEHMRQEVYKDRGNKWNPFDNKRVTDWYANNANGAKDPASVDGTDGANGTPGADGAPGTTTTNTGTQPDGTRYVEGMKIGNNQMLQTNTDANGNPMGVDNKGRLVSSGEPAPSNIPEGTITTETASLKPGSSSDIDIPMEKMSDDEKRRTDLQSAKNYDPNNPTGSTNTAWQSSSTPSNQIKERVDIADRWREEQKINPTGQGPGSLEKRLYNDWQDKNKIINLNDRFNFPVPQTNNSGPGVENSDSDNMPAPSGNTQDFKLSNPGLNNPFLQNNGIQNPTGPPVNQFGIVRQQQGGFIPSYAQFLEYGGYLQEAKTGITVDQPDFSDPNFIGRTIEQNAYSFDKSQLGADLFGKGSITDLFTKGANSWNQAKQDEGFREQGRSSDASKPNTGQSGFGSAEVTNFKGAQNQYGKNIQNIGDEGNNIIRKMGGAPNKQYQKGRVYTLTLKQIKEIEAAGGKIEYLK